MAQIKTFFVCYDYLSSQWELPIAVKEEIQRCLISWQTTLPPTNGGIPVEVARMLANVLANQGRVTYPTEKRYQDITFFHASQAEDVERAFDTVYFDWNQRGQVLFLSPKTASPPTLSIEDLYLATNGMNLHKLEKKGIVGVILPGVDGDVAGIYTFNLNLREHLLAGIRAECERIGAKFQEVTEAELADALANISS